MFAYVPAYGKLGPMGELNTSRLRLVPLELGHVAVMHELSVDPEVRRYLFEGHIIPIQQVEEMITTSELCFNDHGIGFYAMYIHVDADPNDGAFVGFCGVRVFEDGEEMELLFGMQPRFWGHGYGQEAARAVIGHGFGECGFKRIVAAADTPNQRSVRVLQRLGMSFKERREWHGLDTMFYEITPGDFAAL
jgi:RimJ/RimL family protein N-acetyltransferase